MPVDSINSSVWSETVKRKSRPALAGDIATDVLVIGGGMCGILTAYWLQEAGLRCIVVEAKEVGGGATHNTTAKITAQHGLIYADLIERFGLEKARQYYESNSKTVARFHALDKQYPCDFEAQTAYVYAADDRRKLEREAEAYHKIGISSRIEECPPLPLKTVGVLSMEGQAQFHPLKLLVALADGLTVYENTFVRKLEGLKAYTADGTITAKHVILATHYPLVNILGLYFMKLYQHRSYVIALKNAPTLDGMYLDERENGHSFRSYGDLLFIGGGDHKTGEAGGGWAELRSLAGWAYPHAVGQYHWAAQDCMTLDRVPYIGRHRAGAGHLYVATGFNKWGMTGSMAAAELLAGLIAHGKSEYEALYAPGRSMMTWQFAVNAGAAAKGLLSVGGPRCTHMGCKLRENTAERSWDCPCHGSRFDKQGHVMDGPAKNPLPSGYTKL